MNTELHAIWALGDDDWTDATSLFFAIAELLWALDIEIPDEWGFRASPLHERGEGTERIKKDNIWPDTEVVYLYETDQVTEEELVKAGSVLSRYQGLLKLAGRDY